MLKQLETSLAVRRWLAMAVAFLLLAGTWVASTHTATAASVSVDARDFAFTPAEITVNVGDTVTWTNGDSETHSVDGGSLSGEVPVGGSFAHTFTAPEEISYFCRFHTYMTGTIHVVAGGGGGTTTTTAAPSTTAAPTTTTTAPGSTTTTPDGSTTTTAPDGSTTTTPDGPTTTTPDGPTTTTTPPPPTGGPGFQDVPDDPGARTPPAGAVVATPDSTTTTTAPGGSTSTTAPGGSTSTTAPGGSTTTTAPGGFQDIPNDPSAEHPPGEEGSSPDPVDPAPGDDPEPGVDLGDGTQLAAYEVVNGAKEFHLTMSETTIETSPGVTKQAYAFNGIVPGPIIRVDEGDKVRIVVDNQLPFPTSTHWHGMILPNDQDGVGGITQPHIEPGQTYTYEWTAVATGTHWYHSHSSGRHIGKGLYGPLEVVPSSGDFDSDRDYRLMLGDTDLGFTINGRSFPSTPQLDARVGETVRLRVINTGDQVHAFHLHGVPFSVVAQDGIKRNEPESMDTLTVSPGQTYDLIFKPAYEGKWVVHCHMFIHSHMTGDTHPEGESGMNGMTTIVNVGPATGGSGSAGFLPDLLPLSSVGGGDLDVAGLLGLAGVVLLVRRRRRLRVALALPPTIHQ
jgi:plastocyanin